MSPIKNNKKKRRIDVWCFLLFLHDYSEKHALCPEELNVFKLRIVTIECRVVINKSCKITIILLINFFDYSTHILLRLTDI